MDNVVDVAKYLINRYFEITHEHLDEMKLHKLLYFAEREAYAILGQNSFAGTFEGWKLGPVCREIKKCSDIQEALKNNTTIYHLRKISEQNQYIIDNIILGYGCYESWKLSEMSHKEISWLNARKGLTPKEKGNKPLSIEDIKQDASKLRPYDYIANMYFDEFNDTHLAEICNNLPISKWDETDDEDENDEYSKLYADLRENI